MTGVNAYYNEFDPKAAAWLRELIRRGLIADGDVDERSITDVKADDLSGYGQCHFFAGIGGWSLALRLAGVPDAAPVWTGSCPCQPFSVAGKAGGVGDERHLWPAFHRLIAECRPSVVFGEQVASKDGRLWLAGVRADLERGGYAVGAANLCAAGVGAPHIRQRLYWVADCDRWGRGERAKQYGQTEQDAADRHSRRQHADGHCGTVRLADAEHAERRQKFGPADNDIDGDDRGRPETHCELGACGEVRRVEDTPRVGRGGRDHGDPARDGRALQAAGPGAAGGVGVSGCDGIAAGFSGPHSRQARKAGVADNSGGQRNAWRNAVWLPCRDGKARRVESGLAPLAHGVPARVVRLRGYGNAIVPPLAAEFVMAAMEAVEESQ